MEVITVKKALEIILNSTEDVGIEEVNFINSIGRILKEDIVADRDFPPFDRVSMDGVAIDLDSFNKGRRHFQIEGIQPAGSIKLTLQSPRNCIEVMTGAVLPQNTNAVIPYEMVTLENGFVTINIEQIKTLQNVHLKGTDRKKDEVLIKQNTVITPAEIGVLATAGKSMVQVAKQPRVIIISTGTELVEVDEIPKDYQIRRSNVYSLVALLQKLNIKATTAHIQDDKITLATKIASFLKEYDVLMFSGGVSKGKFDFLPEILENLGVQKLFHKIQQRPGKPFWFGKKDTTTVFAFPGNPVSTFVNCVKYFYPWYYQSVGLEYNNLSQAMLSKDFLFKPELVYFLQVKLHQENGILWATPIAGKGSGDLINLVDADAFLELPSDRNNFSKGEVFNLITYR